MFDHLFENRNTTVTSLLKLGDCLARSLRENVELFSIDSETKAVAYLSERGKVISGKYDFEEDITFNNIKIQDSKIFTDNDTFDAIVDDRVSSFVGELNSNSYGTANDNFTDILSLWENRLKFENVKKRLVEKSTLFSETQTIIKTEQFQRFLEIMPQFISFLNEERDNIQKVKEIENAIKLSNSVSTAFNFPRISYETIQEEGTYTIPNGLNKSVYELICKQELVKKELIESKKNFEDVWATNSKIRKLASLIFEDSDEVILENLVEAVVDVPYLALTTKKQLTESISNAFSLSDNNTISTKELKAYVATLFEMKKPLKQVIINLLNEKYGINVQNLKDTASFKGLANTQVVIFESLMRLAPKKSVVKETLAELSKMLGSKNGVEVIDVNALLQECFNSCNYTNFCDDFKLVEGISFENILDEEVSVVELLEKAKAKLLFDKNKKGKDDNLSPEVRKDQQNAAAAEAHADSEADEEDDSIKHAEAKPKKKKKKKKDKDVEDYVDEEDASDDKQNEEAAAAEAPPQTDEKEEAPDTEGEVRGEEDKESQPISKEEFLDSLKELEDLMKNISPDEDDDEDDDDATEEEIAEE